MGALLGSDQTQTSLRPRMTLLLQLLLSTLLVSFLSTSRHRHRYSWYRRHQPTNPLDQGQEPNSQGRITLSRPASLDASDLKSGNTHHFQ